MNASTLTKNTGVIALNVFPFDSRVYLNERLQTNFSNIELPEGTYLLKVENDGYENVTEYITLEKGGKNEKNIRLKPLYGSTG